MFRVSASCNLLLVLLLGALAAVAQPVTGREGVCPRAAFPPVLDGRLNDWQPLPQLVMSDTTYWQGAAVEYAEYGGPDDMSAEVRLLWDSRSLYLAISARDDSFVRVGEADQIDRGDSLVLTFTDAGTADVNQFVVAWLRDGSLVWRAEPAGGAGSVKTITRALSAEPQDNGATVVTYELAIPWSELKPTRPIPGARLDLVISACDVDDQDLEGCLEASLPILMSAVGIAEPRVEVETPASPMLSPAFPLPAVARFDRKCFAFLDQPVIIFAGQVDYARLPREAWPDRLAQLESAGMNAVSITVPWSRCQPSPGEVNLTDLEEFLDLCKQMGLLAQVHVGPFAGEDWEAGAVPEWVLNTASRGDRAHAIVEWYDAVLPVVAQHQLTNDGPVATLILRPLPAADAALLEVMAARLNSAGIAVPVLSANAPAARDNTRRPLANLLDTLSFYAPPDPAELAAGLRALSQDENGPATVTALPGDYRTQTAARRSFDLAKVALANGAAAFTISDFAPGLDADRVRRPGDWTGLGIIDPAGGRTPGWAELRLLGAFLQHFGPALACAMPAEGVVQADDPQVQVAARLTNQESFIFLWDEQAAAAHQVRLTYIEPGVGAPMSIPQAGAIYLPSGGARVIPLDVPVGRGVLRYTTSEIAGVYPSGERTILVLYGDPDTPGEIALRWPGPPLVLGETIRQSWDADTKTLILDYYHGSDDQCLLVDELEILVLSRPRAAAAVAVTSDIGTVALTAGAHVHRASLDPGGVRVVLECPEGPLHGTAVLPGPPSAVAIDGEPVEFTFTSPARVLSFDIATQSFESGQRPASLWRQVGQSILGGPPKLHARFDRSWFMPDTEAPQAPWTQLQGIGAAPDALGLTAGSFIRLRTSFSAPAPADMVVLGSTDPAVVSINGRLVPELSGPAPEKHADVSELLSLGANEIDILLHLLPRAPGAAGLAAPARRLPEVMLTSPDGQIVLDNWELSHGLRGEAAGWADPGANTRLWHLLRFGPWRAQGAVPAKVWGAAWYRVPFGLPPPEDWQIAYRLRLTLDGTARLYLNGTPLATCHGAGEYALPLPAPPLERSADNVLAVAAYGLADDTGLHHLEITADKQRMTRRRVLDIRF